MPPLQCVCLPAVHLFVLEANQFLRWDHKRNVQHKTEQESIHGMHKSLVDNISSSAIIRITTQQLHKQLGEESDAFTKHICIASSLLLFFFIIFFFCKNKWSGEGLIAAAASPFQFKCLSVALLKWNKYILNELWYFANLFFFTDLYNYTKTSKHAECTGQRHSIVFSFNSNLITGST